MKNRFSHRSFLKKVGYTALTASALPRNWHADGQTTEAKPSFRSHWPEDVCRPWPGPEYWSNPLQDWRGRDGRVECFSPGGDRNVFLLTRESAARSGSLELSVRLGKLGDAAPYEGWPIVLDQMDNGLWGAQWELERIDTPEFRNPVVQVQDESNGEVVYTLRTNGTSFTPRVRQPGSYTVLAYDPDGYYRKVQQGVQARKVELG
ncbi:MAG TPA: hypothetical protein VMU92_12625 [Acidobacteriaceae bacterium]|nr:hypothetical protein [Acidobacteriaceae bacterium]